MFGVKTMPLKELVKAIVLLSFENTVFSYQTFPDESLNVKKMNQN